MAAPELCPHGYANHARCGKCRAERRGRTIPTGPYDPPGECKVCFRTYAIHHAQNMLVAIDERHEWAAK